MCIHYGAGSRLDLLRGQGPQAKIARKTIVNLEMATTDAPSATSRQKQLFILILNPPLEFPLTTYIAMRINIEADQSISAGGYQIKASALHVPIRFLTSSSLRNPDQLGMLWYAIIPS